MIGAEYDGLRRIQATDEACLFQKDAAIVLPLKGFSKLFGKFLSDGIFKKKLQGRKLG